MAFYGVFSQVLVLFFILVVGFVVRRMQILNDEVVRGLSGFLLKVAIPALIIDSLQGTFSVDLLQQGIIMVGIAVLMYAALAGVAVVLPRYLGVPRHELGVFRFAVLFSNVGFMGYPVVLAVFGQEGLFFAAIFNLPFNLIMFTLGIMMLRVGEPNRPRNVSLDVFISPAVLSVFIGLAFFVFSFELPGPILMTVRAIGGITTPLSMIVVGALLASIDGGGWLLNKRIHLISVLRLIVIPLSLWLVLRTFTTDRMLLGIPTLIAAMPAAANTAILAAEHNANATFGAQVVFVTTLLSAVTIPLLVYFLL